MNFTDEAAELISVISHELGKFGASTADEMHNASDLLLEWVGYLSESELTNHCDHFIDGVKSLILEAMASASAGLYRSSMFSMRAQIDVVLSWLYFKDHPVEWLKVKRENKGYKLHSDAAEYLNEYYPRYREKNAILLNNTTRKISEPYRVLSAHIHSIGDSTVPSVNKFKDLICSTEIRSELVDLQSSVSEYVSDILLAVFGRKWASLPEGIIQPAKARLEQSKQAIIFS